MNPIFKKLQVKEHNPLCILNAPEAFLPNMDEMHPSHSLVRELPDGKSFSFILIFVKNAAELEHYAGKLDGRLEGDGLLWIAYPKKSSKLYKSDINRDSAEWKQVGKLGFEPVRMVAIDTDWSALRFRKVEFIKSLKRNPKMAISEEGLKRMKKNNPKT